jgi:hypothetical protein
MTFDRQAYGHSADIISGAGADFEDQYTDVVHGAVLVKVDRVG